MESLSTDVQTLNQQVSCETSAPVACTMDSEPSSPRDQGASAANAAVEKSSSLDNGAPRTPTFRIKRALSKGTETAKKHVRTAESRAPQCEPTADRVRTKAGLEPVVAPTADAKGPSNDHSNSNAMGWESPTDKAAGVSCDTTASRVSDTVGNDSRILVASWNCSGFAQTNNLIKQHYGCFGTYLQRLGAAIFCVQETKILPYLLQSEEEAKAQGAIVTGYKSFWAFNKLKGKLSGFNGVATWVREDVAAQVRCIGATQEVLRDPLDAEGRCLLVELGNLVILNVYIPCASSAEEGGRCSSQIASILETKLRFLELLQRRVDELRSAGKQVLLCGDFNLTWRTCDCSWTRRWVEIQNGCVVGRETLRTAAQDGTWMRVASVTKGLRTSFSVPAAEAASHLLTLSPRLRAAEDCSVSGHKVAAGLTLLSVNGKRTTSRAEAECEIKKATSAELEYGACKKDFEGIGISSHAHNEPACEAFFRSMVAPQGCLVDTFAHVHSTAVDRFTCWNQMANLRYANAGSRLDYIFCDAALAKSLIATPTSQLAGAAPSAEQAHEFGHEALNAATNFGRWRGAPLRSVFGDEGGLRLQQDDMRLNETQFRAPHTGMLYTPPSYSDHIPVCALFAGGPWLSAAPASCIDAKMTRHCTPWVKQKGLSNFFAKGSSKKPDLP